MRHSSYLRSFRNSLRRNVLYTVVNVSGFALSLAFVIYLGLYVQNEYSVDSFHANKDCIYRLEYQAGNTFGLPIAEKLKGRYPEIQKVVPVDRVDRILQERNGDACEAMVLITDSTFFSVFSFPFVEGSPRTAMQAGNDIVMSETFARRIYGSEPALGKPYKLGSESYTVSGVVQDFDNTHFRYVDVFFPVQYLASQWGDYVTTMDGRMWTLYLQTVPGSDLTEKVPDMQGFLRQEYNGKSGNDEFPAGVTVTPLEEVYFQPVTDDSAYQRANNGTFLTILIVIALAVLLFAIINYINLSVAQIGGRAQQTAIRRLLGESRTTMFMRYIVESVILSFMALLLGFVLIVMLQYWLQSVLDTRVSLSSILDGWNFAALVSGTLVLGVVSGSIPAWIIARFKPIEVVRGTFRRKTKKVYSKILIAFQYLITIILTGCTITIWLQLHYMKSEDMGFDNESVIVCSNLQRAAQQAGFRDRLLAIPAVTRVAFARGYPMSEWMMTGTLQLADGNKLDYDYYMGDSVFLSTLDIQVLQTTGIDDNRGAYWLNETAWRKMGLTDDATEFRSADGKIHRIRGKLRDFHSRDMTQQMRSCIIGPLGEAEAWDILIKIKPTSPFKTMDQVRMLYNADQQGDVFDGKFLSRHIAELYEKQERVSQMISILAFVAILISSLGMLAMAVYFTRQRMQEVAVRKTFGAQNGEVLRMLILSFMKLVAAAFVMAVPVIWYVMHDWLSQYAYRIGLSWWIFAGAGLLAFLIAGAMVFGQSLRITHTPPIAVLRKQ